MPASSLNLLCPFVISSFQRLRPVSPCLPRMPPRTKVKPTCWAGQEEKEPIWEASSGTCVSERTQKCTVYTQEFNFCFMLENRYWGVSSNWTVFCVWAAKLRRSGKICPDVTKIVTFVWFSFPHMTSLLFSVVHMSKYWLKHLRKISTSTEMKEAWGLAPNITFVLL